MKIPILLSALLLGAVAASAQPADTAPKLVNDLPFPLVAPEKAQQLAITQPIVLNFDNATLGTVLDELKKQSGVQFEDSRSNDDKQSDPKISVHLNTLSFDEALREILDEAGLKARLQDWGEGNLHLSFGETDAEGKPRKTNTGLFQIALSSVNTNLGKSVDLSNFEAPQLSENRSLSVNLALQSDRRLPIVGSPQTRLTRADDDKNRSLVPKLDENSRQMNRYNFYNNSSWQRQNATIQLTAPAPDAKMLAHLDGVIIYSLVTKTEHWEVPNLLTAPQWTHTFTSPEGTVEVKISATPNTDDESGGLKVKIEANSSNDDQSYERIGYPLSQIEPLMAAIRIEDANGTIYRNQGYNATGGKNAVIRTTFVPENQAPQAGENGAAKAAFEPMFKFVMNAPVEVVQTEVPFSFENVPLPSP